MQSSIEVSLGGVTARWMPLGSPIEAAARRLSTPDRAVHAARFAIPAPGLRPLRGDPVGLDRFAHDALFAANPDTRNAGVWHPSYRRWNPRSETVAVRPVGRGEALASLQRLVAGPGLGREARGRLERGLTALFGQVIPPSGGRLYEAHWDNRDDTSFDGVIAVDPADGSVSVLMTNDFA